MQLNQVLQIWFPAFDKRSGAWLHSCLFKPKLFCFVFGVPQADLTPDLTIRTITGVITQDGKCLQVNLAGRASGEGTVPSAPGNMFFLLRNSLNWNVPMIYKPRSRAFIVVECLSATPQ